MEGTIEYRGCTPTAPAPGEEAIVGEVVKSPVPAGVSMFMLKPRKPEEFLAAEPSMPLLMEPLTLEVPVLGTRSPVTE